MREGLATQSVKGNARLVAERNRTQSLSILAITSELPWPLNSGGHLRSYHMLRAIGRGHSTRVVVPIRPGEEEAAELLRHEGWRLRTANIGPRGRKSEIRRVTGAALRRQPYVMFRRHYHESILQVIDDEVRREPPDLLYLDHLDPLVFWNGRPPCKYVVDLHNVYSTLLARIAEEQRGVKRLFLRREARLLKGVEQAAAENADALFCVSEGDAEHFRRWSRSTVRILPNGVDCATYAHMPAGRKDQKPVILFLGAMSWVPNAMSAQFLARNVMPELRRRYPDALLRIIGRDPAAEVRALCDLPGVEVSGAVPSVLPYLAEASVLAVPLESGGGTRLKILESFAAGLPVVSTPIGCEGLDVTHGEHLLVASRSDFVSAIGALVDDDNFGATLADNARRLVRARFDWQAITDRACAILEGVAK